MTEIRVVDDPAAEAALLLREAALAGGHIALSGGSTPRRAYALAAEAGGDWSDAVLWLGDDRCVPADHELSNHRLVQESLVAALAAPPRLERVLTELGPEAAGGDYEARLRAAVERLDLALMGLGPDAHTASLFPGKPEVEEERRWVVGVPLAGMEPQVPRVTLTLPVFNSARRVVFLVAGADKAPAVRRVFGPDPDRSAPAARVRADLVICDAAAAAEL